MWVDGIDVYGLKQEQRADFRRDTDASSSLYSLGALVPTKWGAVEKIPLKDEDFEFPDLLGAAYEYLTQQRHVSPDRLVVYGESLGAAIAADLASKVAVGGLVIEEGFTSTADVGQGMFPFLPVRWLVRNKYDTLSKMSRIKAPVLILHSHGDEFFNMRHAQRLLAAANEPKQLVELQGGHNDAFLTSATIYHDALHRFFVALKKPQ